MRCAVALLILAALSGRARGESEIARLRAAGHGAAAAVIAARVAQRAPKLRLSARAGERAARAARHHLARSPQLRALERKMPRSTVELIRAIAERGLPASQADAIADYLAQLVSAVDFARLDNFDRNHSHVTGRRWQEIDYSGEAMTWQGQRRYWAPRGVLDFRSVEHIHAYMKQAAAMKHFARVYHPRHRFDRFRYRPTVPRRPVPRRSPLPAAGP